MNPQRVPYERRFALVRYHHAALYRLALGVGAFGVTLPLSLNRRDCGRRTDECILRLPRSRSAHRTLLARGSFQLLASEISTADQESSKK